MDCEEELGKNLYEYLKNLRYEDLICIEDRILWKAGEEVKNGRQPISICIPENDYRELIQNLGSKLSKDEDGNPILYVNFKPFKIFYSLHATDFTFSWETIKEEKELERLTEEEEKEFCRLLVKNVIVNRE